MKNEFRGDAPAVAQVTKVTPSNVEIGDVFTLTINGKSVSYTAAAATVADVTAGLTAAWNASAIAEFAEVTAADQSTHVELTADVAGVPFTVTASVSGGSTGALTIVEQTKGAGPTDEVQKVTLLGSPTGGTFTITWDPGGGAETTTAINFDATADDVQTALEGLTTPGPGDFAVTGPAGGPWFVQFIGTYAQTDVNLMSVDGTNLTGAASIDVTTTTQGKQATVDEIQFVQHVATVGTYTLSFQGEVTAAINFNDSAAAVQAALEALGSIGSGNVAVIGGHGETPKNIASTTGKFGKYFVRFQGDLAGLSVETLSVASDNTDGTVVTGVQRDGGLSSSNEFQFVDLAGATGGTFTLATAAGDKDKRTADLDWNEDPGVVETQLEGTEDLNNVSVFHLPAGFGYLIEFLGTQAGTDVALLLLASAKLTPTSAADNAQVTEFSRGGGGVNEVQEVTIAASGGSFTLTFDGQTTASIAFGATAATVETELQALSNVTDVTVTGTGTGEDPYVVTFVDPGQQDVAEMTGDASSLTGGAGEVETKTEAGGGTNEVQHVNVDDAVTSGTFTLTFEGETTNAIAFDAAAGTIETELESLSTIGSPGVTVTGTGSEADPWVVTFDGPDVEKRDLTLMSGDGSNLVGGSGTENLTISEDTRSAGAEHWDDPLNWVAGWIPETSEDVELGAADAPIRYGIRQRTTFTADAASDTLTMTDLADFREDQKLRVRSDGTLPAGLSAGTDYFVINLDRDAKTLQLSTTKGGSAVDITDAGTGTHTIAPELQSLVAHSTFGPDGELGLPQVNENGSYWEYRPRFLEIGLLDAGSNGLLLVGRDEGPGSGRIKIDVGLYQPAVEVNDTGGAVTGERAVELLINNASCNVLVMGGDVGIAIGPTDSATVGVITLRGGTFEAGDVTAEGLDQSPQATIERAQFTFNGKTVTVRS